MPRYLLERFNLALLILPLPFILGPAVQSGTAATVEDPATPSFTGLIVGITDGDTIVVMHGTVEEKVRLHGIDCPESEQPFGTLAKQFTTELVSGKTVTVEIWDIDRYGRTRPRRPSARWPQPQSRTGACWSRMVVSEVRAG